MEVDEATEEYAPAELKLRLKQEIAPILEPAPVLDSKGNYKRDKDGNIERLKPSKNSSKPENLRAHFPSIVNVHYCNHHPSDVTDLVVFKGSSSTAFQAALDPFNFHLDGTKIYIFDPTWYRPYFPGAQVGAQVV